MTKANAVFDFVIESMGLTSDAALARAVEVSPPVISKMRHGSIALGSAMIIYLHEASGISIRTLKALAGKECLPSRTMVHQ